MTYHARSLEGFIGVKHGYRVTHVDEFDMKPDGSIGVIKQSYTDRKQIKFVNPFEAYSASCVAQMAGVEPVAADEVSAEYGVGKMAVKNLEEGGFTQVQGVDFADGAKKITLTYKCENDSVVKVVKDKPDGEVIARVNLSKTGDFAKASADANVNGVCDLFFIFEEGTGVVIKEWKFN